MSAKIIVLGNLVGVKQARDGETLTEAGWAKREGGEWVMYKNSIAWTKKKAKGEETTTFARITAFGKRYEWLSKNLYKGSKVMVTGDLTTTTGKDGKTYLEIEVHDIDIAKMKGETDGESADAAGDNEAPASSKAPVKAPVQKYTQKPKAPEEVDDNELPF